MKKIIILCLIVLVPTSTMFAEFYFGNIWKTTKPTIQAPTPALHTVGYQDIQEEKLAKTWRDVIDKFEQGSSLLVDEDKAPQSAYFVKDKSDYKDDFNELLNDIVEILVGDNLLEYKNEISSSEYAIKSLKNDISEYHKNRIGAAKDSILFTTKDDYARKIENAKKSIKILEQNIKMIKVKLNQSFKEAGINLSIEQIEVLLSRVDGDDIIKMTVVMNTLNGITEQIAILMKTGEEDLYYAKKYYGMHLISWMLVMHIEQHYIHKMDRDFIPKIDKIVKESIEMINKTQILIEREKNSINRRVYNKNLDAQKENKKIALEYKIELLKSRSRMAYALEIAKSNLAVARNTYDTISLSSQLHSIISENQAIFGKITNIQMPSIVPFENKKIKQKYKELTGKLREE